MPPEMFPSFPRLAIELQNLIWEATFSQPRVFDDSTLRLLNPQNGVMYSYLTPYALYICRDSRDFAQSHLCRTFLFRAWPRGSRRAIYFNPKCDACVYRFTDLSWASDFIPGLCSFSHVEILANVSPDALSSAKDYGLRSTNFFERFSNLKRLFVRDRHLNLTGSILRNGWNEDRWSEEARSRQEVWKAEWKLVEDVFKERGIEIIILPNISETERTRAAFMATFPTHHVPASKANGGTDK